STCCHMRSSRPCRRPRVITSLASWSRSRRRISGARATSRGRKRRQLSQAGAPRGERPRLRQETISTQVAVRSAECTVPQSPAASSRGTESRDESDPSLRCHAPGSTFLLGHAAGTGRGTRSRICASADSAAGQSIAFVERRAREASDLRPRAGHHRSVEPEVRLPEDRIAVFDQDGTLWVVHPMYTQVVYCLERLPAVAARRPELQNAEPFKTVLSGNRDAIAKLTPGDLEKILAATLSGMTVEEFNAEARKWIETAKHPRWNLDFSELGDEFPGAAVEVGHDGLALGVTRGVALHRRKIRRPVRSRMSPPDRPVLHPRAGLCRGRSVGARVRPRPAAHPPSR